MERKNRAKILEICLKKRLLEPVLSLKKEEIAAGWKKVLKRIEEAEQLKSIEHYSNN